MVDFPEWRNWIGLVDEMELVPSTSVQHQPQMTHGAAACVICAAPLFGTGERDCCGMED